MSIFIAIWFFAVVIQLFFWGVIVQRLAWYSSPSSTAILPIESVSVIICARNEGANLQNNLEQILTQDYSDFEVIVVNDYSEDNTASILAHFQQKYAHLKVVFIGNKTQAGKKQALTQGILAAKNPWLLMTDADCIPASPHWISSMMNARQASSKIVLGYSPYLEENTWVNKWVQYETTYTAIQYLSFALWKMPYMGVGRNLLYHRSLFNKSNGFEQHQHIASGDDDLFINEVATSQNTCICIYQQGLTRSKAPSSWQSLYRQKTRHYSASSHYQLRFKLFLGLLSLSHFVYYIGIVFFCFANIWKLAVLMLIMTRTFIVLFSFIKLAPRLQLSKSLLYFLFLEGLLPLYYVIFAYSTRSQPKDWK